MLVLKADPWLPDYGMGFDVAADDAPAEIDAGVETEDWSTPLGSVTTRGSVPVTFVDGVRRAELRLLADQDGERALGLFGSYAVGSVECNGRAVFGEHHVGRALILGSGLMPPRISLLCGRAELHFEPTSDPGAEPDSPLQRLQTLMRDAESRLAADIADSSDCLVLCDGPIGFLDRKRSPVVGVIKRFARAYLDPEREQLLPRLRPAERTPLFGITDRAGRTRLYAWYMRLAALRPEWHDYAGLVRCEVAAGVGVREAVRIANQVTGLLPSYAGRPSDPRAPQNLAPIGGLESWLRHRLGDSRLIRHTLISHLASSVTATPEPVEVLS